MAHVVEVDQSFKFENTKEATALALANGISYSILIPATVKRECIRLLRKEGFIGAKLYLKLFSITLFFLLKDKIEEINHILIDKEYPGKEGQIKDNLINLLHRSGYSVSRDQVLFSLVGKVSNAHIAAIQTLRKKRKPDRILTVEDIVGEFKAIKKSGPPFGRNAK